MLPSMALLVIRDVGKSVLYDPYGSNVSLSFKLEFACSNNEIKHEELITTVEFALQMVIEDFVCKEILCSSNKIVRSFHSSKSL